MPAPPAPLGDSHNFGRRVTRQGDRIEKPRTLLWEWLLLSAASPLRHALDAAASAPHAAPDSFAFLPDLRFYPDDPREARAVEAIALAPLGALDADERRHLARVVGRAVALHAWLGLADLHWENLALGRAGDGRIVFTPLDVELILDDFALPTATKLIPDGDPEIAAVCRHAAGVRRALPWLGKPLAPGDVVALAAAYRATLALLDAHAPALAAAIASTPGVREAPIRVCLRGTGDYLRARPPTRPKAGSAASGAPPMRPKAGSAAPGAPPTRPKTGSAAPGAPPTRPNAGSAAPGEAPLWPPLLEAEAEQLARGDIPYFFRRYGQPGIHHYTDAALERVGTLPRTGDVPRLEPLLSLSRHLRSPRRAALREHGTLALLAAFEHASFAGAHTVDGLTVEYQPRAVVLTLPEGDEVEAPRHLPGVVGSVYLPCRCGEVATPLVPAVTTCEAAPPGLARRGAGAARRRRR